MTAKEIKKLRTIIIKVEMLQSITNDKDAQERLQSAKNELIRLEQRMIG